MGMCADLLDQLWHVGAARIGPAGPPSGGVPSVRRDEGRVVTCATNLLLALSHAVRAGTAATCHIGFRAARTLNLGTGPAARFLSVCICGSVFFFFFAAPTGSAGL